MKIQTTAKSFQKELSNLNISPETAICVFIDKISVKNFSKIKKLPENDTKPSKWANMAQRIRNDSDIQNPEFQKAWKKMKTDMKELREDFEFNNDK